MPAAPSIGKPFTRSHVETDEGEGGSFFSKIPIWAWIAGGVIVLYVLYTKFFSNTSSTSNPAVTTTPDQTGSPYTDLSTALQQVLANEQSIASLVGSSSGSTPTSMGGTSTPATTTQSSKPTSSAAYSNVHQPTAPHNSPPPTAPPIHTAAQLLAAKRPVVYQPTPPANAANPRVSFNPITGRTRGTQAIS